MVLDKADYWELMRWIDRTQVARYAMADAQRALDEAQRKAQEVMIRVGLNPNATLRVNEATFEVSEEAG